MLSIGQPSSVLFICFMFRWFLFDWHTILIHIIIFITSIYSVLFCFVLFRYISHLHVVLVLSSLRNDYEIHFDVFPLFPSFFLQPRLGPKPFSVGSGDVNFDKVFSVPQVPGNERITVTNNHSEVISDNQNKSTESSDNSIDEQKDSDEKEGNFIISHADDALS